MRRRNAVERSKIAPTYAGGDELRPIIPHPVPHERSARLEARCRVPFEAALVPALRATSRRAVLLGAFLLTLPGMAFAEPAVSPPRVSAPPPAAPAHALEDLIEIPDLVSTRSRAASTDETLAAAVAAGTNPDLVRPSGFRKKSSDLFRTEREVEIGNQEMLLRLRLRAKARKAVSVELRF